MLTEDLLMSQLAVLSLTRSYRRLLRRILDHSLVRDSVSEIRIAELIGGLLLIEMHQRPGFIRAVEWVVSIVVPARIRRPITRGPLQMANGPWSFQKAVAAADSALDAVLAENRGSTREALNQVAFYWNGASSRQPGAILGYAEVLNHSYTLAGNAARRLLI